ncbi:MAG: RNA polymerase sigma factor [Pyrinomonadaceae bacterium]
MACLIEEVKVLRMSDGINSDESKRARRTVLLEVAYKLFAGRVYTLCLSLLGNVRAAEEATVQVFAQLGRELGRRWNEAHILTRLRELAIDESLRRVRLPSDYSNGPAAASMSAASQFEEGAVKGNTAMRTLTPPPLDFATLDARTSRLPNDLRVAFVLHDREGLSYKEVARHLQMKEAQARELISRARLELRRLWLSLK